MAERGESSASSSSREESTAAASSSSFSSAQVREEEEEEEEEHDLIEQHLRQPDLEQQHIGITYRGDITAFDDGNSAIRDDTWSCIVVVLTFWFFVSMTLILGVYGSVNLRLGPNSSLLIQPNSIFVQTFKVEELDDTTTGPLLYGFYKTPALDVVTNWSTTENASVAADSHQEWIYYLNEGSQISISYNVNTAGSPLFLVIAQGNEGLAQWLEDPTYPNTTLSWNLINGVGKIQQDIYRSANYYVAVGNLNADDVEVQLDLKFSAYLYNTSRAYYKCTFSHGACTLDILFPSGNTAVLATPSPGQGTSSEEWYVRLSYGPRWITYIVGIGGMTMLMLVAFNFMSKFQSTRGDGQQYGPVDPARAPLLTAKDDDLISLGSSYDSASQDEEDLEEFLAGQGKLKDVENGNSTRRLCSICFDAPRDCFFLPCGHCVACFECGTRILEASGTCPLCCRDMKKVRKIFTV